MRTLPALVIALASSTAAADTSPPKTPDAVKMASDDCARARKANKTRVLDMGGEDVIGDKVAPPGVAVSVATFAKHDSLIRIRRDFIVEILKSAEDID